jgi:hypothetical protein
MKQLLDFIFIEREKIFVVLILLVFFAGLLAVIPTWDILRYPDESDYIHLAGTLIERGAYLGFDGKPTAYRPPGYPFLLSILFRLWEAPLAAKLLNAAALAGTAFLLGLIAADLVPEGMVFAPLLVLFYPVYFYTAGTLYPQVLGAFLFSVVLYLFIRFHGSRLSFAVAGSIFAFLVLMIPGFLLISPFLVVFIIITNMHKNGSTWTAILVFLLGFILVTGPWIVRNAIVFKKAVPISTNSGENLLLGNSENTTPNSGVNVDITVYLEKTTGMNETERDAYLRNRAFDWIKNHPFQAGKLYLGKFVNFFNYRNRLYVQSESSALRDGVMFFTYYPLLFLAVLRLFFHRRYPLSTTEVFLYALYLGGALLGALFFTRIRFRLPYDTLLIAIGAIFLGYLNSTFRHSNK